MLTREVISDIARREGVPLHAIERDYIQHLFLREVGEARLAFKGGTCLRIVFGSPRYSEDLDFTAIGEAERLSLDIERTVRALRTYGIEASWSDSERRRDSFRGRLRFQGPLFTGVRATEGTVRVDVSLRGQTPVGTARRFVSRTPYPEVPQLVITSLADDELFAEKLRALLLRAEPRDAFDIHYLLSRGIRAPVAVVNEKLRMYHRRVTPSGLSQALRRAHRDWERDLGPLLRDVPPFEALQDEILRELQRSYWPEAT